MSDPVIKGAKKASSRTAPQNASSKTSGKGGKLAAQNAKPKPKRAAAEKAPVRKASPARPASGSKTSKTAAKPAKTAQKPKAAPKPPAGKAAPKGSTKASAPSKQAPATAKQPANKGAAAPAGTKTQPPKAIAQPKTAQKSAQKPAARPAPQAKRQPTHDEAAALKAFERAHKEFARGNFSTARDLFRSLIDQHAGVSEVTARARTYLNIAESRLRTEASLPRDPDMLYERGVFELNRGDFVAAQEMFERALKRDSEAADTHYALAATRARLGAIPSALQSLERAVELRPVLRVRAQSDIDLAPLRSDPDFERIVYGPHRP
jgi:hypothetical protein